VSSQKKPVPEAPNNTFPAVVSIALKSAAAVKVGLTYKPLVIPVAVPVWLIVPVILKEAKSAVPLDCTQLASDKNILRKPLVTEGEVFAPAPYKKVVPKANKPVEH
jgi:hypothetical protein